MFHPLRQQDPDYLSFNYNLPMKTLFYFFIFVCFTTWLSAQTERNLGVLAHAGEDRVQPAYNLLYPHNNPSVFLLDNCGRIVHSWEEATGFVPGNTAYILSNGNLLKTKRALTSGPNNPIWAGGGGETIELRSWDNDLLASVSLNNDKYRFHHDIAPMPNGHVLAIAWEAFTYEEAIAAGRNPALLPDSVVWAETVIEYDLLADSIVWQWHVWDHLVQDFDETKENFGTVNQQIGKININYAYQDGVADWLHINAIDYNPRLDQIVLSVPHFDEIWIIDHSTTIEEAATNSGGLSGKGGELIYRWGNPQAYGHGTAESQKLYYNHDIAWIDDFLDPQQPYYGQLSVFNNRLPGNLSTGNVFDPAFDTLTWAYPIQNGRYLPLDFTLTLQHPTDPASIYSAGLSGVQLMPNGNFVVTSGRAAYAFELDPNNEIVWEYRNPLIGGQRRAQGSNLTGLNNLLFRLPRYPLDYNAFQGRDLSPGEYMELSADTALCSSVTSIQAWEAPLASKALIFPNPSADGRVNIRWPTAVRGSLELRDVLGRSVWKGSQYHARTNEEVSISALASGTYFLYLDQRYYVGRLVR